MKIVVPMAGRGSRFLEAVDANPEYRKPKPLISILGKPMVQWAIESLSCSNVIPRQLLFISLEEYQQHYKIADVLTKIFGKDITVLLLPYVTRGALETALAAKKYINSTEDVVISDSDHYFDGDSFFEMIKKKDTGVQGIIPVFQPQDAEVKWSYTIFDSSKKALKVAEKDPILASKGAYANIGAYYFSHGSVFVKEAEEMIATHALSGPVGKQEFFIAPLYQRLIDKKMKVQAAIVRWMWGLGTPKDVEYFERNYENI